jgi:hypothetical protein
MRFIDPAAADAVGVRQPAEVVAGAAPRVDGLGLEEGAHVAEREAEFPVGVAVAVTCPEVGASSPTTIRMVVDFPAPLGPRKPVTSPGRTLNVRWSTAKVDP